VIRLKIKENWKMIVTLILISLLMGGVIWSYMTRDSRPFTVKYHENLIREISKPDYLTKLKEYARDVLKDPFDGKDYIGLLEWESKRLQYSETEFERRNMPIEILAVIGLGRCGEFSLLYYGLCITNGIPVRLIVDNSYYTNVSKSGAGDHVWVEIFDNKTHVDPTEVCSKIRQDKDYSVWINNPLIYGSKTGWNKEINEIWAISDKETILITERYQ